MALDLEVGVSIDTDSGQAKRDVLQQLISEGLNLSPDIYDPDRYRRLFEVLFDACILRSFKSTNSPYAAEHAIYTLKILHRHTIARPGLLLEFDKSGRIPLYKWILPRLVCAATRCIEDSQNQDLVNDLCTAASSVILLLRKDENSASRGDGRYMKTIDYLLAFCQDIVKGDRTYLFGFKDLETNGRTVLVLLQIVISCASPFSSHHLASTLHLLAHISFPKSLTSRLYSALTSISGGGTPMEAVGSRVLGSGAQISGKLLAAIQLQPVNIQFALWQCLRSNAEIITDAALLEFLLQPIPGVISMEDIKLALGTYLQQWEVMYPGISRGDRLLPNHKRKREPDNDSIFSILKDHKFDLRGKNLRGAVSSMSSDALKQFAILLPQIMKSDPSQIDIWQATTRRITNDSTWRALEIALKCEPRHIRVTFPSVLIALGSKCRRERIAASRILASASLASDQEGQLIKRLSALLKQPLPVQTTTVQLLGSLGRHPHYLPDILEVLITRLASSSPVRSLAYTELLEIARHHNKTPYALLNPYLDRISVTALLLGSEGLAEITAFIGQTRQDFISTNLGHTLPALVLARDRQTLNTISSIIAVNLGPLLVNRMDVILTKCFLNPNRTDSCLKFLSETIGECSHSVVTTSSLVASCIVPLTVALIVELGDPHVARIAELGLRRAQRTQQVTGDLGTFLKPHMLGVMTHLNETLHDLRGKKSVEFKQKLIRSLGELIKLVGDSMTSYSPQIMASLQSTLGIPELRQQTLSTWADFINTLRFNDIGPFVGRTTGALVGNWSMFTASEKSIAASIIDEIAGNASHLSSYVNDVVGMSHIPELRSASKIFRQSLLPSAYLTKLVERSASKNAAIATTTMREIRDFMLSNKDFISHLSQGDTFDVLVGKLMHSLLTAAAEGDGEDLRNLSYECLGILGALDSDRFVINPENFSMIIMTNFADEDEATDFAIHLIRDLLVDAFRATNDTKLQGHLAFAIQELLKFCKFTDKTYSLKTRSRWDKLPKDHHDTLTPLLASRFELSENILPVYVHPIYPSAPTYREWVQRWTTALIGRNLSFPADGKGVTKSQAIFGVFRGVLRNQDVSIAHHILPHLVLNVLLSGDEVARSEIRQEINAVLQDQVNPLGAVDKRTFSAQAVFELMDHLSRWLRMQRVAKSVDRGSGIKVVDSVVSSIDTELMANAALQSKAYARSLRSFEQRIIELRSNRENSDLQTYFERVHEIYAELDEPDGMEGVSTFVIAPSLEHQIREHESTGRWTSAQSCWEVRLQQSPEDVSLHIGLLKCLRNLGHYDTLRTHIRGVLSRRPTWAARLAHFEAESAWITGDWATVEAVGDQGPPLGAVLLAMQRHQDLAPILEASRHKVGRTITSKQYGRAHDAILQLHLLRDVEMVRDTTSLIQADKDKVNEVAINKKFATDLIRTLQERFNRTSPTFRVREEILTIRRALFGLATNPTLRGEIGPAWIQSSKIARKAGYEQTAYSASLQAKESDAPFAFIQQVKLLKGPGGAFKALTNLENAVTPLLQPDETRPDFYRDKQLAKAVLLEARWANETDRFEVNEIVDRFRKAIALAPNLESPFYHLGHYYDTMVASDPEILATFNYQTCHNYILALQHGVKYIYQTMPRMLTLWLDLGESKDIKKFPSISAWLTKISAMVDKSRKELPTYQFFTAFPQIVSRIGHPNKDVVNILRKIMALVIETYPQQALWPTVGLMQSKRADRKQACKHVLARVQQIKPSATPMIKEAERLSTTLLRLADDKVEDKKRELSIATNFPYVSAAVPSKMIMPLQDLLTSSLPIGPETLRSHNPFPMEPVEIKEIRDRIEVMPSLQRPKKLVFVGTDGKRYPFLCKPHDDLRKDARLMDFNSMINKLLKSASESRRRNLYIRTYAVMPLNEECGLLEWVANTNAFKGILEKEYERQGKKLYDNELHNMIEEVRKAGPTAQIKAFKERILPRYTPTVFYQWFLLTWPEPTAWLASRMAYARTLAVMSMIGYVLGLGDRHGENILFDGLTGDTVHVDLNCLFDKGKTFEIPERVPFRLTHNMVDALGITGVEGVFRKAAEISMSLLRTNSDSLMSVLEAFAHDPLVEWSSRPGRAKSEKDIRVSADRNLRPIRAKLRGIMSDVVVTIPNQVDTLIKQATSASNLAVMYQGWAPWL